MISRRLFCFLIVFAGTAVSLAQEDRSRNDKDFTADLLITQLFARTTDDQEFCAYVIQKRDDGTIPTRLIYGVYRKALSKDPPARFTYFKTGLTILCKQEGIVLDIEPTSTTTKWSLNPLQWFSSFKSLFQR